MSKEYRKATDWELSTAPLRYATKRLEAARKCGNARDAARHAVAAVSHAIDARCRGQVIDADNIDPEDMLQIKTNAVTTARRAAATLHVAKRVMVELCRRIDDEWEAVRPAADQAKREREARENLAALGSRGPYASICGTYRACKN